MSIAPQLVDVLDAHRFDEKALLTWLQGVLPEFGSNLSVQQFQGGQSNPTFLLEADSGRYVLRKKPPGKVLPSAHMVEREYRVIRALAEHTEVPVPRAQALCEDSSVIGTPFYLMEFMPGRIVSHPALRALGRQERLPAHQAAIDALAKLHSVDVNAVGLGDFGRPQGYVARQVARWTKQYLASKTDELPAMDRLMAWLPENLPATDETAIAHGDYRFGNLMLAPDKPEVIGILDWELSTLGHPLADLAYYCLPYHLPSDLDGMRGLKGDDLEALGIPDEEETIRRYCRQTGRAAIEDWHVYLAFSLFRLAAIVQGVYARALQGNASNADALEVGKRASLLAEAGWRIAQRGEGGVL
ncbi:phosphotransferase [Marinobacter zhejiangensis]|uniref:Predicted kinase, aminoglycoside phosphotransferase (APT) family n=1 Tax=Marinobacter zhejiangensis TaxID=488535 RepID=A0A1I4M3U0_9GAMM|nr:phosphotransferase [Marinobacter zhejiangensis]SFL97874.1 Predicted kinase, aminoglycoside phosphotransferase (APT) family [Marinobacter zhejiangensis]